MQESSEAAPAGQTQPYPELFIGLVAAVGIDHGLLCSIVDETLAGFQYRTEPVRLASLLHSIPTFKSLPTTPVDAYIAEHQQAGNKFRELIGRNDSLAALAINEITERRASITGKKSLIASRTAYILRSLKTPDEVKMLRDTYGSGFILIACSAPYEARRRYLAERIAKSRHDFHLEPYLSIAEVLIQSDQEERNKRFGQNLKNTFPNADVFLDASDAKLLRESVQRYFDLLFGEPFHTPTRDEYAMFQATGAQLRSSELGRQVGAAVATKEGDIIAVGTNEVPRAGGGLYWAGDEPDFREFVKGEDSSDVHKRSLIEDLLNRLKSDNWLAPEKARIPIAELARMAVDPECAKNFSAAHVSDLIEFGRAVHAEQAAICDAARRGVSIANASMYVTTFPCHLCARLIVAAGIARVVYIEPYTKSLTLQLFPDSMTANRTDGPGLRIPLEPFTGVAPRCYMSLFTMRKRKLDDGKAVTFDRAKAFPRLAGSPRSYIPGEVLAVAELDQRIEAKQLMFEQKEFPNV
jgi:cytidine deaminase